MRTLCMALLAAMGATFLTACADMPGASSAGGMKQAPAQGYTIHVMAPHKYEDGTVHGPYHHYCKPISADIIQCLLFESNRS
jgi:hypothetical protein